MDLFRSILTLERTFKQLTGRARCEKAPETAAKPRKVSPMGGVFSSPSPPPPPPPPPPEPDPVPTESEAEIAEKAARERRRRAQSETIATSWRGVDDPSATTKPAPKRLLGE